MSQIKRIIKELDTVVPQIIKKNNLNYALDIIDYNNYNKNNNYINTIALVNKKTNTIELFINFTKDYPFKPPKLTLNNINNNLHNKLFISDYSRWSLSINKDKNRDELFNAYIFTIINNQIYRSYISTTKSIPSSNQCLCCDSLVCSNNWYPSIKIIDLVLEYLSRKKFKFYLKPLINRYITNIINGIFNNDKWYLNDDCKMYILNFI